MHSYAEPCDGMNSQTVIISMTQTVENLKCMCVPSQCGSEGEHQPMIQEVMVPFLVRARARLQN